MKQPVALVIDDETDIRDLLQITLGRMDVQAITAATIAEARQALEHQRIDLCLTDMNLPDGNGLDVISHITQHHPDLPVAMITAYGNMDSAVAAMKAGAFDFVPKPVDLHMVRKLVETALRVSRSAPDKDAATLESRQQLLGDSAAMDEIRQFIARLARNQAPVFITGESGTGKELAARLIHAQGPRRQGRFVAVNCGAIPSELVESELFGHKRGSFTGAVNDKEGLFQAAEGGTLFLDEVADLPLAAQVKLLRAIQEKSVRPVGAPKEVPVDVRIISASHHDLANEVEQGRFRQDLFYRINVIELRMPALRERPHDIPELARKLLARIANQQGEPAPVAICEAALETLEQYAFPGNVRELENILERAIALREGARIEVHDLHLDTRGELGAARSSDPAPPTSAKPPPDTGETPADQTREPFDEVLDAGMALGDYLDEIEKRAILAALDETHWNRTAAAKKLGMTLRSLRYRLNKLGIE